MERVTFLLLLTTATLLSGGTRGVLASNALLQHHCQDAVEPDFDTAFPSTLEETAWQRESTRRSLGVTPNVPEEFLNIRRSYLAGQRACPSWRRNPLLHGGPLCPSFHIFNYDENRVPRTLVESRCSCRSCLRHPDDPRPRGLASALECQPVFHYTPVHRRVNCTGGVFQYRQVWEPLVVACTCAMPSLELE